VPSFDKNPSRGKIQGGRPYEPITLEDMTKANLNGFWLILAGFDPSTGQTDNAEAAVVGGFHAYESLQGDPVATFQCRDPEGNRYDGLLYRNGFTTFSREY